MINERNERKNGTIKRGANQIHGFGSCGCWCFVVVFIVYISVCTWWVARRFLRTVLVGACALVRRGRNAGYFYSHSRDLSFFPLSLELMLHIISLMCVNVKSIINIYAIQGDISPNSFTERLRAFAWANIECEKRKKSESWKHESNDKNSNNKVKNNWTHFEMKTTWVSLFNDVILICD